MFSSVIISYVENDKKLQSDKCRFLSLYSDIVAIEFFGLLKLPVQEIQGSDGVLIQGTLSTLRIVSATLKRFCTVKSRYLKAILLCKKNKIQEVLQHKSNAWILASLKMPLNSLPIKELPNNLVKQTQCYPIVHTKPIANIVGNKDYEIKYPAINQKMMCPLIVPLSVWNNTAVRIFDMLPTPHTKTNNL
jgi:hypothetical protein